MKNDFFKRDAYPKICYYCLAQCDYFDPPYDSFDFILIIIILNPPYDSFDFHNYYFDPPYDSFDFPYYFDSPYDINDDFALDAAFFSRYVSSIFMQELNVRCTYKESVWLGTSVRMPIQQEFANAIAFMLGYQFQNNMHIGYSYDLDIGKIGQASRGSHEIMLGIRFTKNNKEPLIPHEEK